ncbi:hypothetical protein OXX79_002548 [Metschnikowia pulcherrima]
MRDFCKYFIPYLIYFTHPVLTFSLSTPVGEESISSGSPNRQGLPEIFTCPDKQGEAITKAEDRLAITFRYMTSFVKSRTFDSEAFAKVVPIIDRDIQDIAECVQKKAPDDVLLSSQLEFVKSTSQDYMQAVGFLGYYTSSKTSQHLARSVVKLNVHLITLQDSFGNPRKGIVDYDDLVTENIAVLEFWDHLFQKLTNLPPGMGVFFESQYTRARQKLARLENHIKDHRSWNAAMIARVADRVHFDFKFIVENPLKIPG